jgi:predicted O-methyltransferase YrrM
MNGITNRAQDRIAGLRRIAARLIRVGLLAASRRAASMAETLRRKITKQQIQLDGIDTALLVKPIGDIPTPQIDIASDDVIAAIMAAPEFTAATAFFADNPVVSRSLVSAQSQALLYCLVRNLQPDHVFEIGTFRAGTTEAICRALYANGRGVAHTVDPFYGEYVVAVLKHWPPELLRHIELYSMDSMAFYKDKERSGTRPGLVFVDGNHDYEFALFDIGSGGRAIVPGGFVVIDNVAQAGPFFAGCDFLAASPGWRELGSSTRDYNPDKAFDRNRTAIVNTDFMILRAPNALQIDKRPRNFGLVRQWRGTVNGVRINLLPLKRPGVVSVQVVLRGFGVQLAETLAEATAEVTPGTDALSIAFTPPAQLSGQFIYFTVEPWLIWRGEELLQLVQPPQPY